ncbi:MAG: S46 family peptidase, partial [bacterium]
MYPLSALQGVDLEKAGLRIPKEEIFNPGKVSLTNALVRLGGCTGSFVSGEGLVITNHHCVEGAVSRVNIDY